MTRRVKLGFVLVLLGLIGVFPPHKASNSPDVAARGFLFASFIPDLSSFIPDLSSSSPYHPGSMEAMRARAERQRSIRNAQSKRKWARIESEIDTGQLLCECLFVGLVVGVLLLKSNILKTLWPTSLSSEKPTHTSSPTF